MSSETLKKTNMDSNTLETSENHETCSKVSIFSIQSHGSLGETLKWLLILKCWTLGCSLKNLRDMWGLFPQEKHPRSIKLHFLHLIWQSRSNRNNEISFTTSLLQGCPTYPLKSKRWEIICPRLWQGHCSRLTKEYSNFIEWKATQSKQTPKPLSRHPSPAGLLLSPPSRAPAIQGKCVFPTLELSSRVCPAGVLPRGERGDGLEVTSTHIPLRHVTSSPPVALALLASSSEPERLRRGGRRKVKQSRSPSAPQEYEDF